MKPNYLQLVQPGTAVAEEEEKAPAVAADPNSLVAYADLPAFDSVLTAEGGQLALKSPADRAHMAVVKLQGGGVQRQVWLLSTPNRRGGVDYLSLRERCQDAGFMVIKSVVCSSDTIKQCYDTESRRREKGRKAEDGEVTSAESITRFEGVLMAVVAAKGSDVHLCVREKTAAVLMRLHADLDKSEKLKFTNEQMMESISVAFNKLADPDTRSQPSFNARLFCDCVIEYTILERAWRFRFQWIPAVGGGDVIMRVLHTSVEQAEIWTLDQLGYAPSQVHLLNLGIRRKQGVITVGGPTGSGKTTVQRTLLSMIPNRRKKKIYSMEDPIEYRMHGVTQISFQRNSADDDDSHMMTEASRAVLRGDPDVINIGEIREQHMAELMATMVQSGHQALTGTHIGAAIETIAKLSGPKIGLDRQLLAARDFISVMVFQKLVPKLCPECKRPATEVYDEAYLDLIRHRFDLDPSTIQAANPEGCEHCKDGVKGMTVVAEVIVPNLRMLQLFREGRDGEAEEEWRSTRFAPFDDEDCTGKTALEHGLYKVSCGLVDPRHLEDEFEPFEGYRIIDRKLSAEL